jgi:DNA primase
MASVEEVKQIIKDYPISGIINFYHPITKRGSNYEGICPFHSDTKPSLKVNDAKGLYKCFACGAAGDSIGFVQNIKNLEFIEAIKDIAGNLGITVDELQKKQANPEFEMSLRVLSAANRIYKKVAKDNKHPNFLEFIKKRNLNEESIENFGLGYAPNNNAITNYLNTIKDEKDKTFAVMVAKKIGLLKDSYKGPGLYDFFRDRIMFPIWDHSGILRAFQSRAVLAEQNPKYLNSPDSAIFQKGSILYGFNLAKNFIRQKDAVIVVEGNMDVVVLHQFGFQNSVGTMGVAFNENSARLLSNMTKNIILAMDSDAAGLKGMDRMNEMFLEKGIMAKYLNFAPAKDPDEFLQEFGRVKLEERIELAPTFLDFRINLIIPDPIPEATDRKLEVLKQVFDVLLPLKENLIAKEFAIKASKALGLRSNEEDIIKAYVQHVESKEQLLKRPVIAAKQESITPVFPVENKLEQIAAIQNQAVKNQEPTSEDAPTKMEKKLIEHLVAHPECLEHDKLREMLDFITHSEVKQIVLWLQNIYLEIDDSDYESFIKSKLEQTLHPDIKNVMSSGLFSGQKLKLNKTVIDKMLADFKTRLQHEQLVRQKEQLMAQQKNCVTEDESMRLMAEVQRLGQAILALKKKK